MSVMTPLRPATLNVTFTAPPPGFSPVVDFELSSVEGAIGLFTLKDRDGADLRLFLVDPAVFVPGYDPEFTDDQLAPLGADSPATLEAFVVATMAEEGPVVNLMAPILVNPSTNAAAQVILDDTRWPLRAS
ncbi:flagellar assembly protein FliW [Naasia aerilata]|nr:flagellar assembly protein FliW [Naasia aerilata]